MKFYKIDLLTLLISLFLFASCESSSTIGLDVNPETAIQGNLIDTLTISTQTLLDEPTSTARLPQYPLGFLTDPIFGITEASLAMSVNLPNSAYSIALNATLDSAVLVLPYATEFYGDSTSTYSIDVHQLTENLSTQTAFMSNKNWAFDTSSELGMDGVIGNYTGRIKPNTSITVTQVKPNAPDTVTSMKALRIKLDNNFITNKILRMPASGLVNNAFFNSAFKGLHVSVNKQKSIGTGAIPFFNLSSTNSRLEVYYKQANATTATKIDTVAALFTISNTINPVAATIKHDYTGTEVETQLNNTGVQHQVTYLQGPTGLRNKISFPNLSSFIQNLGGNVIINKAELVIDLSAGTDVAPFVPAGRLAIYRYDIAGQRVHIPDINAMVNPQTGVVPASIGKYNAVNKNYTFTVTNYLQELIDGKTQDYGTFLATTATSEFNLNPLPTSGSRSVIGSFANPANKVKLNIYYTKIK